VSHAALQRVAVRMLHDPTLVAAVYADAERALADADLSAAERATLTAVPAAAWRTDAARPARVLAALTSELVASASLAPAHAAAFFASPHFHRAVASRGSLALAFGAHMAAHGDARIASVARLETAIAAVRRAPRRPPPSPPGRLRLAPSAAPIVLRAGTSRLLDAGRRGDAPPALASGEEHLLVLRTDDGDVTVEEVSPPLWALLEHLRDARTRADALERARALGADPGEDEALIERLVADRLVS
jgi:hypothetical protein